MEPIRYSGKVGDGNQVVVNDCDGLIPALGEDTSQRITKPAADDFVVRVGPTSMRKPLSRPERDDCGTSQTSIRRHPPWRSALRGDLVTQAACEAATLRL